MNRNAHVAYAGLAFGVYNDDSGSVSDAGSVSVIFGYSNSGGRPWLPATSTAMATPTWQSV